MRFWVFAGRMALDLLIVGGGFALWFRFLLLARGQ